MKILFFAHLREQIGASIELECAECTIRQLMEKVVEKFPDVDFSTVMVAVNEEFATSDTLVQSTDVVALIPPVSGG